MILDVCFIICTFCRESQLLYISYNKHIYIYIIGRYPNLFYRTNHDISFVFFGMEYLWQSNRLLHLE